MEARQLLSHEQPPTVDRKLHFDRFFALTLAKNEDARNSGKTHENEAMFWEAAAWLALASSVIQATACLICIIIKHNTKLR